MIYVFEPRGVYLFVPGYDGFCSFRCSWEVGSVRVALSVDRASSRLLSRRCCSSLCSLACIAVTFSMCISVCPSSVVCLFLVAVSSPLLPPHIVGLGVLVVYQNS